MLQEQPFQVPRHSAQAALEVRLHHRLARVGPEALLAAVGEQPGQGDQTEVGEQLLLDRALGLAVELLHRQQLLGNLVQFLDAPAAVVQVGEVPHAVALPVVVFHFVSTKFFRLFRCKAEEFCGLIHYCRKELQWRA